MGKQENVVDVKVRYVIDQGSANSVQTENSQLTQALTVPVQANRGPAGGVSSSAMGSVMRGSGASASRQSFDMSPPVARIPQPQTMGAPASMASYTNYRGSGNLYNAQAGPRRVSIPSQGSQAFTSAFSNQSDYGTPQEYAAPYAQANYEGAVNSRIIGRRDRVQRFINSSNRRMERSEGRYSTSSALDTDSDDEVQALVKGVDRSYAKASKAFSSTPRSSQDLVNILDSLGVHTKTMQGSAATMMGTAAADPTLIMPGNPGGQKPITAAQVNRIYNGMMASGGNQTSVSDAAIRAFVNGAPGPGGSGSGAISPSMQNMLQDPSSYNFGSRGWMMAQRSQFIKGLPGLENRFARGAMVTAGRYAGEMAQNEADYNISGRRNISADANATGSLVGGLIGSGLGALTGTPFGAIIGASVGQTAGGAISNYIVSRDVATLTRQENVMGAAVMSGSLRGDYGRFVTNTRNLPNPTSGPGAGASAYQTTSREWQNPALASSEAMAQRAFSRSHALGARYWTPLSKEAKGDYTQYYMSPEQMSKSYSTVYSALIESGINPEQMVKSGLDNRTTLGHAGDAAIKAGQGTFNLGGMTNQRIGFAQVAIGSAQNFMGRDVQYSKDPLYAMLVERGAIRWGKAGEAIIDKAIAPIIGSINTTGNNTADILMKHGVGATNSWIEDTTEIGKTPRTTLQQLMDAQSTMQRTSRSLAFSQLKPRGRGASAEDLLGFQQTAISAIPGGDKSLIYAQLGEERRQAGFRKNREEDIMGYDLPMASLEGQEQRRQFLPNMPGYGLKLSLQRMGLRAPQIAKRSKRYAAQVVTGMLSEEEQLSQYNEIQGMENEQARDIGYLAEGGQDRALAFSGGRPSFFGRMDSISLARSAVWRSGSPQIGMGGKNGQHLQYQNDFFRSFDNSAFSALDTMKPHSRTANESGPFQSTGRSEKTLESIRDILQQIAHGNGTDRGNVPGGGAKSGEKLGNRVDNQNTQNFDPRGSYGRSGF